MARPKEITKILKTADSELAQYVVTLEKENQKLHNRIAKLQVDVLTKDNEIKALKKNPPLKINIQQFRSPKSK